MSRGSEVDEAVVFVADSLGVRLARKKLSGISGFDYEIRLTDIPEPYGFVVLIGDDYRSWLIRLDMDEMSGQLLSRMEVNARERFDLFCSLRSTALDRESKITIRINGKPISPDLPPDSWESLRFEITRGYSTDAEVFETLREVLLDSLSILLCLVIENESWEPEDSIGEAREEGGIEVVQLSRHERSRFNRAICLQHYGFVCAGCGLQMDDKYGPIGLGVIHVHHLFPLADMDGPKRIDPISDLIPLCPNCHNIVHRKNPPLPIKELNELTDYQTGV